MQPSPMDNFTLEQLEEYVKERRKDECKHPEESILIDNTIGKALTMTCELCGSHCTLTYTEISLKMKLLRGLEKRT